MVDWICDYYQGVEDLPVRSELHVGDVSSLLPAEAPVGPESWTKISQDFQEKIMPGEFHEIVASPPDLSDVAAVGLRHKCVQKVSLLSILLTGVQSNAGVMHWQSPNFYAYFPSAFSFPSLLGDLMSSALSVNGFLWVSSPAATELETVSTFGSISRRVTLPEYVLQQASKCRAVQYRAHTEGWIALIQVVVDWLGKMMGLPQAFLAVDNDGNRGRGGGVVQVRMSN